MLTAENLIKEMYLLPMEEREKVARHIIEFGIKGAHHDLPEILNIKEWQDEIASKPFNLKIFKKDHLIKESAKRL